jgi:hypothetical protein
MKKDFVIRGQTASGETEILEFGGYKEGYAYRLVEFQLFPSASLGSNNVNLLGSITAGKAAVDPQNPSFLDEGLIATYLASPDTGGDRPTDLVVIINDTFLITQNLILMVVDTDGGDPINWQCRFVSEKMTDAQAAVTNFKQFSIFDG